MYNKRTTFNNFSNIEILATKSKLESYSNDLKNYNKYIQSLIWTEDNTVSYDNELQGCDTYFDEIADCMASLSVLSAPRAWASLNTGVARNFLRSPTAPLPTYEGTDNEDLTRFLSQFEDTLSKFDYPEYDKFLLLKQQLKGRARILIDSLEISNQTYQQAIKLLKSALDSPVVKKFNLIKNSSELNLS